MGNCFLYKRGFGGFGGGFGGGSGGGGEDVPGIEKTASGKVISILDSMEKPLKGLRLFGKTTQNGTPSPDAPVPMESVGDVGSIGVTVCGKNLWNNNIFASEPTSINKSETGFIFTRGNTTGGQYVALGIPLLKGQTVTFSANGSSYAPKLYIYRDKVYGTTLKDGVNKITYTPTEDIKSAVFAITISSASGDNVFSNIQVEYGAMATTFEPYKEPQTLTLSTPNGLPGVHVSEGGNYTDENGWQWICDEVDFARGVYVQRVNKVIYDGSSDENWRINGARIQLNLSGIVFPKAVTVLPGCLCDHYERKTANNTYDGIIGISIQGCGDGAGAMFIRYGETADLEAWKAMLAESPITCLFALATPVETDLTPEQLSAYAALHTLSPSTTIYNDADSYMEVKYMAKGG